LSLESLRKIRTYQISTIQYVTWLSLMMLAFNKPLSANEFKLPNLGSSSETIYTPEVEVALGDAFRKTLFQHYDIVNDPIIVNYIESIGYKIAGTTGQKRHFEFLVIQNDTINAFAGPNGIIGIHTGLIAKARTEDELASVIAHEIAHVTQEHLSRRISYQSTTDLGTLATIIATLLVGSQDANAGMAVLMSGMSLNIQNTLYHSRVHEKEADYYGIGYLAKSHYNPHAMGDFFEKLHSEYAYLSQLVPEILKSHPVSETRLAQAEDRANQMPPFIEVNAINFQNAIFSLIQMRVNSINRTQKQTSSLESCYQTLIEKNDQHRCSAEHKTNKLVALEIASQENSLEQLTEIKSFYPNDFSIPLREAKLIESHSKLEATKYLQANLNQYQHKRLLLKAIAKLSSELNNIIDQNYYLARLAYHQSEFNKSKHLLKENLKNRDLTKKQLILHNQLLKEVNQKIKQSKLSNV